MTDCVHLLSGQSVVLYEDVVTQTLESHSIVDESPLIVRQSARPRGPPRAATHGGLLTVKDIADTRLARLTFVD